MTQDSDTGKTAAWPLWYHNCKDKAVEVENLLTDTEDADERTVYYCVPAQRTVLLGFTYGWPYSRGGSETGNTCTPE